MGISKTRSLLFDCGPHDLDAFNGGDPTRCEITWLGLLTEPLILVKENGGSRAGVVVYSNEYETVVVVPNVVVYGEDDRVLSLRFPERRALMWRSFYITNPLNWMVTTLCVKSPGQLLAEHPEAMFEIGLCPTPGYVLKDFVKCGAERAFRSLSFARLKDSV